MNCFLALDKVSLFSKTASFIRRSQFINQIFNLVTMPTNQTLNIKILQSPMFSFEFLQILHFPQVFDKSLSHTILTAFSRLKAFPVLQAKIKPQKQLITLTPTPSKSLNRNRQPNKISIKVAAPKIRSIRRDHPLPHNFLPRHTFEPRMMLYVISPV